jgi:hypothetical protein
MLGSDDTSAGLVRNAGFCAVLGSPGSCWMIGGLGLASRSMGASRFGFNRRPKNQKIQGFSEISFDNLPTLGFPMRVRYDDDVED